MQARSGLWQHIDMKPRVIDYLEMLDRVESGEDRKWPEWAEEGRTALRALHPPRGRDSAAGHRGGKSPVRNDWD